MVQPPGGSINGCGTEMSQSSHAGISRNSECGQTQHVLYESVKVTELGPVYSEGNQGLSQQKLPSIFLQYESIQARNACCKIQQKSTLLSKPRAYISIKKRAKELSWICCCETRCPGVQKKTNKQQNWDLPQMHCSWKC